ncbi:hypothetical protein DB42_CT00540 [Neochlamydia sp. EPS4]|nr:hypothetical protein DB42_CT00540 [Neochlamydia sp. EPS4]KIC76823.1 hypothetical protein DB41_EH00070 [Neochlamydia sp. TUME1]
MQIISNETSPQEQLFFIKKIIRKIKGQRIKSLQKKQVPLLAIIERMSLNYL